MSQRLIISAYLLWASATAIGVVRLHQAFLAFDAQIQKTQALTVQLADQTRRGSLAARGMQERTHDSEYLQSLVRLLPQSKSFVRTQRAMADEVEALRDKVGRRVKNDLHILVDIRANKIYVKKGLTLLWDADCSVGKGGILKDKKTGRRWEFVTPRGQFDVREKIEKPVWTKPDWAFVETHEAVPPPEDPRRHVEGELGGYVFNLGDGYLIHGTRNETLLGRPVSHGCVRLGAQDLKRLYETVPRGTKVYIY